jgi:hypothetical protein
VTTRDFIVALIAFAIGAVVMGEYIKRNMHAVIDDLQRSQQGTAGKGV